MIQHIGIIGFGAVGQQAVETLGRQRDYRFTVFTRESSGFGGQITVVHSLNGLLATKPALVLEAASADAFRAHVPHVLRAGIDVIAASSGALEDADLLSSLAAICSRTGARLIVPPGAIGGLDYLAAVRPLKDVEVVYTSRKPPAAWAAELQDLGIVGEIMHEPVVLFEGNAQNAARLYPRNLNAGLTIALAVGITRTRVRVLADPTVTQNTHEIHVTSSAGTAFMRFENHPAATNPKTSALTGLSLAAMVRRYFDPVSI